MHIVSEKLIRQCTIMVTIAKIYFVYKKRLLCYHVYGVSILLVASCFWLYPEAFMKPVAGVAALQISQGTMAGILRATDMDAHSEGPSCANNKAGNSDAESTRNLESMLAEIFSDGETAILLKGLAQPTDKIQWRMKIKRAMSANSTLQLLSSHCSQISWNVCPELSIVQISKNDSRLHASTMHLFLDYVIYFYSDKAYRLAQRRKLQLNGACLSETFANSHSQRFEAIAPEAENCFNCSSLESNLFCSLYKEVSRVYSKKTCRNFNASLTIRKVLAAHENVYEALQDRVENLQGVCNASLGYRFGADPNKLVVLDFTDNAKTISHVNLTFRTTATNGILFAAGTSDFSSRLFVFLTQGVLVFRFSCDRIANDFIPTAEANYLDGKYHSLELIVKIDETELIIDDQRIAAHSGAAACRRDFKVVYFGGIPALLYSEAQFNGILVGNVSTTFSGCLAHILVNQEMVLETDTALRRRLIPCAARNEPASLYFPGQGGSVVIDPAFDMSTDFIISVQIKPRARNFVLLSFKVDSAYATQFFRLAVVKDVLMFSINTDSYTQELRRAMPAGYFCDGHWHEIMLRRQRVKVGRSKRRWQTRLELHVDFHPKISRLILNDDDEELDNIVGNLVFGVDSSLESNNKTILDSYRGCMREIRIDRRLIDVRDADSSQGISLSRCPVD